MERIILVMSIVQFLQGIVDSKDNRRVRDLQVVKDYLLAAKLEAEDSLVHAVKGDPDHESEKHINRRAVYLGEIIEQLRLVENTLLDLEEGVDED